MQDRKQSAIDSFNKFLNDQKELGTDTGALMTLIFFNTTHLVKYDAVSIERIPALSGESYVCDGGTALYDAVGMAIDNVGKRLARTPEDLRPAKVIVTILTDGQENSSRKYDRAQIESMIRHQEEKYNWQFIYLSSSMSAMHDAESIGIKRQNTMYYDIKRGMGDAYTSMTRSYSSFRIDLDKH
jgi:uncharacterized protein YegL